MDPRLPPGQIVPASRSPSNPAWLSVRKTQLRGRKVDAVSPATHPAPPRHSREGQFSDITRRSRCRGKPAFQSQVRRRLPGTRTTRPLTHDRLLPRFCIRGKRQRPVRYRLPCIRRCGSHLAHPRRAPPFARSQARGVGRSGRPALVLGRKLVGRHVDRTPRVAVVISGPIADPCAGRARVRGRCRSGARRSRA
jgi:hypothetical protein